MATPSSSPVALTGDSLIDAATHGYQWQLAPGHTINWALANGFSGEFWLSPGTAVSTLNVAFSSFSYYADVNFNYVGYFATPLHAYAAASDITVSLDGSAIFGSNTAIWAIGLFPNAGHDVWYPGAAGDIFLNINSQANHLPSYAPGSAGFFLAVHEIGHTLGLKHPHDSGGTGHPTLAQLGLAAFDKDWFSIMSYNDDFNFNLISWDPATPMVLDVLALQHIYGKNLSTNAGDSTYSLPINNFYQTIWDAGGTDAIDVTASAQGWTIQLPEIRLSTLVDTRAGFAFLTSEAALSSPLTWYWLTGDIEHAIGSQFADVIFGSSLSNVLIGNGGNDTLEGVAGNDTIIGGAGQDRMVGGPGSDLYSVDSAGDVVIEAPGEGMDTVQSTSGIFTLSTGSEVETIMQSGSAVSATGNELVNAISGNGLANLLRGLGGADQLIGGAANDTLLGGSGDDVLSAGQGNDSLRGGLDADLLNGRFGNDSLHGDDGFDRLYGDEDNDYLDGGNHADVLYGGLGADTLLGGHGQDHLDGGDGNDTLDGGIENDALYGGVGFDSLVGGDGNDSLFAGQHADTLAGGIGSDLLQGGMGMDSLHGGAGVDTLVGGPGSDRFVYQSVADGGAGERINDFLAGAAGDRLDLTALDLGPDPIVNKHLKLVQAGSDTQVRIDTDGFGGEPATLLVTLAGVSADSLSLGDNFLV